MSKRKDEQLKRSHMPVERCINGETLDTMSDIELLAILLGTGTIGSGVLDLAAHLYQHHGGLQGLLRCGLRELASIKGIGLKKAIRLHSALELGKRSTARHLPNEAIDSPFKVWRHLKAKVTGLMHEEFIVLTLDNKNQLVRSSSVSRGTLSQTIIHPREIFRDAIREAASSIIVAHNHPSGVLTPSNEDITATKRLLKAGDIVGISLLDHVIISGEGYLSLKQEGYLN